MTRTLNAATSSEHPSRFATTQWTRVLASQDDSSAGRQALSDLCASYYTPVVAFLRREGRGETEAREMAHDFFARVLQGKAFAAANPRRGRFRSYLLGALKHFLANQRVREAREKRGAGAIHESLDPFIEDVISTKSPSEAEKAFDREWAMSILEQALALVKLESERAGASAEYEALKPWLTGDGSPSGRAETARRLGMSDGAMRVAIHRLRKRFREVVKTQVACTVDDPRDITAEMNYLIEALS